MSWRRSRRNGRLNGPEPVEKTMARVRRKEVSEYLRNGCTAEELEINRLLRDPDYCGPRPVLRSNWAFFAERIEMLWPRIY
jgi:hypothetical protein